MAETLRASTSDISPARVLQMSLQRFSQLTRPSTDAKNVSLVEPLLLLEDFAEQLSQQRRRAHMDRIRPFWVSPMRHLALTLNPTARLLRFLGARKRGGCVVIRQTWPNRSFSFFDQYAFAAQRTLAVSTPYPPRNDFCRAHLFVLPTRWEVFLSLEGVGNTDGSPNLLEIPNVDTFLAAVDITRSSWTWKSKLAQITIKLFFPSPELLDAFLFALSYIRLSDFIETRSPSTIPLTERRLTQQDVQRFSEMRASVYGRQATIAVLPVEVLSEIFSLLPPSGLRRSTFASTLLPLWVCSEWRSVAIGTASLWRTPPSFSLTPSFFHRGGGTQAVLWLTRAKGSNIALSIKAPLLSRGIPDLLRLGPSPFIQPSLFAAVQSLDLLCRPSHLADFTVPVGPVFPSLKLLRFEIMFLSHKGRGRGRGPEPSYLLDLFRSAPLLRDASIAAGRWDMYRRHSFAALLPWAQLTALSMRVTLEFSAWVHIFTQCTSLETGQFTLFNEEASPPCPLGILTLAHLVSLRLEFYHVCDTRFFDHLSLPRLGNLHVEGTLVDAANIDFVANYPALRHLTVHLDLFDNGLQRLIQRSSPIQRFAGFQGAGVQRLRSFTVVTSTLFTVQTLADKFIKTSPSWIVKRVLGGCDFELYGEAPLLDQFRLALGSAAPLETSHPYIEMISETLMIRGGHSHINWKKKYLLRKKGSRGLVPRESLSVLKNKRTTFWSFSSVVLDLHCWLPRSLAALSRSWIPFSHRKFYKLRPRRSPNVAGFMAIVETLGRSPPALLQWSPPALGGSADIAETSTSPAVAEALRPSRRLCGRFDSIIAVITASSSTDTYLSLRSPRGGFTGASQRLSAPSAPKAVLPVQLFSYNPPLPAYPWRTLPHHHPRGSQSPPQAHTATTWWKTMAEENKINWAKASSDADSLHAEFEEAAQRMFNAEADLVELSAIYVSSQKEQEQLSFEIKTVTQERDALLKTEADLRGLVATLHAELVQSRWDQTPTVPSVQPLPDVNIPLPGQAASSSPAGPSAPSSSVPRSSTPSPSSPGPPSLSSGAASSSAPTLSPNGGPSPSSSGAASSSTPRRSAHSSSGGGGAMQNFNRTFVQGKLNIKNDSDIDSLKLITPEATVAYEGQPEQACTYALIMASDDVTEKNEEPGRRKVLNQSSDFRIGGEGGHSHKDKSSI
ncbi:hypothetical protein C8R46DRAFT_1029339 [Mycena filopes]|nr:hypothetical protein C8R46DRAFT_1029339 [Mycena filopes]